MTTWQLREDWEGIRYALEYAGSAFEVSLEGSTVTVGRRSRGPRRRGGGDRLGDQPHAVAPVRLILRVGAAPSTLPQGGSATQQCSQASGSSCTISVTGGLGRGEPAPAHAARGRRRPADRRLRRRELQRRVGDVRRGVVGAGCSGRDVRRDVLGARRPGAAHERRARRPAAPRPARAIPKAPASVAQTAYANGTLTLRVDPGEARRPTPRSPGSSSARTTRSSPVRPRRHVPADRGAQRRGADLRGVRRQRRGRVAHRASARSPGRTTARAPAAVTRVRSSTARRGRQGRALHRGDRPRRDRQRRDHEHRGSPDPRRPDRRDRGAVIPGRREHSHSDHDHAVLALRLRRGSAGARPGPRPRYGERHRRAAGRVLTLTSASNGDGTSTVTARAPARRGRRVDAALRDRAGGQAVAAPAAARGDIPGLPDGEEYRFTACVESWYDDE